MKVQGLAGTFWPTHQQSLLLRTVTQPEEAARASWHRLEPRFDLDRLEDGSFALMPMLSRRLPELGVDVPFASRLKGIARRVWYQNRLYIDRTAALLRTLNQAGSETIVIGDVALALRYYEAPELRQITALNLVAVPSDATVAALERSGWRPAARTPRESLLRSGVTRFSDNDGRTCVLQLGLLPGSPPETIESRAEISVDGERARMAGPADELLRTFALGARRTSVPSVVWVSDALSILSVAGAEIDWDRFIERAVTTHVAPTVRAACRYISSTFDAAIPEEVARRLAEIHAPARDRASAWLSASGGVAGSAIAPQIARSDQTLGRMLLGVPAYLRDSLGVEHVSALPGLALRRRIARAKARHDR